MLLINKHEEQVCDYFLDKMCEYSKKCPKSLVSRTFVPYYDNQASTADKRNMLSEVAVNEAI
jgi:hypothetical protein